MKKSLFAAIALVTAFSALTEGEKFRISNIEYELEKTKQSAVERNIPISTKRIFTSKEELDNYIEDLKVRFQNERVFQETSVEYEIEEKIEETEESETEEEATKLVTVKVKATDSKSMLILPYPKYSSSDGFSAKIKMKDANFLGTMSALSAEAYFAMKSDEDNGEETHKAIGFELNYDFPFQAGPFLASWNNDYSAEYTIDTKETKFKAKTGFTFELPFDTYSFVLDVSQGITKDLEYEYYDDQLYLSTDAKFSMPIRVSEIDNWGAIKWTPYAELIANYEYDGEIDSEDLDLSSPLMALGHETSTKRIDWNGNFRNGFSATVGQAIFYNFQRFEYDPKLYAEFEAFKSAKYIGVCARFYAFTSYNRYEKIGERIRGAIDEQKYKDSREKALRVSSAIVLNLDIPIHIVTTDWNAWTQAIFGSDSWVTRHTTWFNYFDFEMQISPFIDMAVTKNAATGRIFAMKDGWYTGGLEVLIFPKRWKSVVVRGSLGFDLGRKVINKIAEDSLDTSWRNDVSEKEIYIGLGLFY